MQPLDRYLAKIDRSDPDGCWPWTASLIAGSGYGKFKVDGKTVPAHRFGYAALVGPIPEGHCVLHTCDNRPCQRPDHWFTGTKADNSADMVTKDRPRGAPQGDANGMRRYPHRRPRGENNGNARLTQAVVDALRSRYTGAWGEQAALAREFDLPPSTVHAVLRGHVWQ